jgi:hypothetical protein
MWKKIPFFTLAFSDWKPFKSLIFRIFNFDFWRTFARNRKQLFKRQAGRHAEVAGSIPIKWGLVHPKKTNTFKRKKTPPLNFPV